MYSTTISTPLATSTIKSFNVNSTNVAFQNSSILHLWATISQILWWTVLLVAFISLPILGHALYILIRRFKKSNYFLFLSTMIILDLLMLLSILFNLLSDYAFAALKGNFMCKLTAFITNVTSCYCNWLWVMMFAQRFANVFFPMHRVKLNEGGKIFRILDDTRQLILITGLMSAVSQVLEGRKLLVFQLWAPFLMKEVRIFDQNGGLEGCFCGPDSTLINKNLFKWIAASESVWTYAIPFMITVFSDMAVLIFTGENSNRFKTIFTENVVSNETGMSIGRKLSTQDNKPLLHHSAISLKIQSKDSIIACHKRRQLAIRRCLMLATMQLLLNLPNYVLQLVDEFSTLRTTSPSFMVFYLYADAFCYLLYLSQYPMMAIYVKWLHSNYDSNGTKNVRPAPQLIQTDLKYRRQSMCTDFSTYVPPSTNQKIVTFANGTSTFLEISQSSNKSKPGTSILKRHSTGSVMYGL